MNKKEYVAGGLFSNKRDFVALVRKNRPDFQKGKLNFIGGSIESGETPLQAQIREFYEETGVTIEKWDHFLILEGKDWRVHFFKSFIEDFVELKQTTDESVGWFFIESALKDKHMKNLNWIIPMALDNDIKQALAYDQEQ